MKKSSLTFFSALLSLFVVTSAFAAGTASGSVLTGQDDAALDTLCRAKVNAPDTGPLGSGLIISQYRKCVLEMKQLKQNAQAGREEDARVLRLNARHLEIHKRIVTKVSENFAKGVGNFPQGSLVFDRFIDERDQIF